jgi:hypothetical protein
VKTIVVVAAVLLVFTGLMAWIYRRTVGAAEEYAEISQMRKLYGAWYLYGQDWNGAVAQNLYDVRNRLADDQFLSSNRDPYLKRPGPYPGDPAIWDSALKNPVRVSFSYLGAFAAEGKVKVQWETALENPRAGLIANPFAGDTTPVAAGWEFRRQGRLTRISVLGAASTVEKTGLSPAILFGEY